MWGARAICNRCKRTRRKCTVSGDTCGASRQLAEKLQAKLEKINRDSGDVDRVRVDGDS